ncbi:MAG: cytochrome P450 [Gemmatimonadaceae bacterium]
MIGLLGGNRRRSPLRWLSGAHRAHRRLDDYWASTLANREVAPGNEGAMFLRLLPETSDPSEPALPKAPTVQLAAAGHDCLAGALTWVWYLLHRNPRVEARLHGELDHVLAGRPPRVADLAHLPVARAVLAEALRLYPALWSEGGVTRRDVAVGHYMVPRGSVVLASQFVVQRDRRWWDLPTEFLPERWFYSATATHPTGAYFPFGAGSTGEIAQRFASREGVLILATLAQRWRFRYAGDGTPQPATLFATHPERGLPSRLESRSSVANYRLRNPRPPRLLRLHQQ